MADRNGTLFEDVLSLTIETRGASSY